MKTALHKGGYWDLNVYTADLGFGLLGWATFPVKNAKGTKLAMDGVVIYHESLPGGNADFGTDAVYNQGDTLTHEAGHWLSLYHTFQGGCSKKGDQVADTPAEAAPNFTCDPIRQLPERRTGPDLIHNFMDYGDDICLDSFTAGQTARMQANWDTLRNLVPVVKKLKPSKGLVGTSVTISGSALSDASAVHVHAGQRNGFRHLHRGRRHHDHRHGPGRGHDRSGHGGRHQRHDRQQEEVHGHALVGEWGGGPRHAGGPTRRALSLTVVATTSAPVPALAWLPNGLTILRFALIPVFIVVLRRGENGHSWAAGIVFGVAAITDQVDGWLARRWHVESEFGKYADPLADRLMIDTAVICCSSPTACRGRR
jgi:hypothetical protein